MMLNLSVRCGSPSGTCVGLTCASCLVTIINLTRLNVLIGRTGVLEALRAAVAAVVQYDKWDEALPHDTFGLNTHVNTATKVSPFEFAHGFPAQVPHDNGLGRETGVPR